MKRLLSLLAVSVLVLVMCANSHAAGFFFISGNPDGDGDSDGDGPLLTSAVFADTTTCGVAEESAKSTITFVSACAASCTKGGGLFAINQMATADADDATKGKPTGQVLVGAFGNVDDCLNAVAAAESAGFKNIASRPCATAFRCK